MPIKSDVDMCHMPGKVEPQEVKIYQKILGMHCENKTEGHKCLGEITITAQTLTLQCPLCGDVRKMMEPLA